MDINIEIYSANQQIIKIGNAAEGIIDHATLYDAVLTFYYQEPHLGSLITIMHMVWVNITIAFDQMNKGTSSFIS